MENYLDNLKMGIMITSFKGDIKQPHNYAMERIPARFSRWSIAMSYYYDIERILKELETAVSFVKTPPNQEFLTVHSMTREDYLMYHQGYFLDLVHQLKDKLCHMVKALVTFDDNFKDKDIKISTLSNSDIVKRIPNLSILLDKWNDGSNNEVIAQVLKKRTQYHHYKNPLPATESYMNAKTHSFMLSASFQAQLSDKGKEMIAERGEQNYNTWKEETLRKMSTTLEEIKINVQDISKSIIAYFKLPKNDKRGGLIMSRYVGLIGDVEVKDSTYTRHSLIPEFTKIAEVLEISLNAVIPQNLVSVYITGSILSRDYLFGLSDINTVIVLNSADPALKKLVRDFINKAPNDMGIPTDTKVFSEEEFMDKRNEKLRFVCKADGLLLCGKDLLRNEKKQKICFKLAWFLNKDFKEYLSKVKEMVNDPNTLHTPENMAVIARHMAKKAYWLGFSQVMGNNTVMTFRYKEMRRLNNLFYPQNKKFNNLIYKIISKHIIVDKEGLDAMIESYEENLLPLYDAINNVVNGVSKN